jgi:mannose-1-phosphate guanylyltransferase/mannose-6-phosphate isomerase
VLAGGAGERFWPASRSARPKPFLQLMGGRSLLDATLARARRVASRDSLWVVCGDEHARPIRRETGLPASRVLAEPRRRDTAAAIGLVASHIAARDPEAVLSVLPADHVIPDEKAFAADIRRAAHAAHVGNTLITIGVRPTRPETGYGYIQVGDAVGRAHPRLRRVRRFVEKPDAARARRFLRGGRHLWNAGIFVWSARTILEEIALHVPALHRALAPVRAAGRRFPRQAVVQAYRRAPSLPIDVAVMEKSRRVWTLPVRWHWSDVGTWESLAGELGVKAGRSQVLEGALVHDDGGGNLVWGRPERPIALLGVEGLAVVDTGDALLVARLDRSNGVRAIVKTLKEKGRLDVT